MQFSIPVPLGIEQRLWPAGRLCRLLLLRASGDATQQHGAAYASNYCWWCSYSSGSATACHPSRRRRAVGVQTIAEDQARCGRTPALPVLFLDNYTWANYCAFRFRAGGCVAGSSSSSSWTGSGGMPLPQRRPGAARSRKVCTRCCPRRRGYNSCCISCVQCWPTSNMRRLAAVNTCGALTDRAPLCFPPPCRPRR